MKKGLVVLIALAATFSGIGQNGAVKGGLAAFYGGESGLFGIGGGITLEYKVGKKFTFAGAFDYTTAEASAVAFYDNGMTLVQTFYSSPVLAFRPELRFYPKTSMNGFFAGLGVGLGIDKNAYFLGLNTQSPQLITENSLFIFPALMVGLNLQPTPHFCIEVSGGLGVATEDRGGVIPLALRLGYSF